MSFVLFFVMWVCTNRLTNVVTVLESGKSIYTEAFVLPDYNSCVLHMRLILLP
jgi:hypothetical protein